MEVRMNSLVRTMVLLFVPMWMAMSQEREALSIERIFAKPSLTGVTIGKVLWSPDGQYVAYARTDADADAANLWLFDATAGKGRQLVKAEDLFKGEQRFSKEEEMLRERTRQAGRGITNFFWSPDSRQIYVPIAGDVFSVDVESGKVWEIIGTPETEFDPKISPTGTHLAFVRNGDLYVLDVKSGSELRLTSDASNKIKNGISEFVAQEEMDRTTGYWWSPDATHIAYLQIDNSPVGEFIIPDFISPYTDIERQEYPKAGKANTIVRVGVISSSGGTTRWLDLGANTDIYVARVDWLPDATTLAAQRQSRNQDTLDVLLFNTRDGSSTLLLREVNHPWVSLHDDLRFLAGKKQFVWSSERDGFNHLYLYDMKGNIVNRITKGEWDVEKLISVDERNSVVFFTATEKSALERHLYSVKLDGSGFKRLTSSDGHHEVTMGPDQRRYADKYSSLTRPPLLALMDVAKKSAAMIEQNPPTEVEKYVLPKPAFLSVTTADGVSLNAMLIKPMQFDATKKYPVIVYVYGGPTSQVVFNRWGAGGGMERALWHRMMAERGYIVFAVDGRGTPGRGRAFQNVLHKRMGYWEVKDQLSGVVFLQSLPYVDAGRIMIWGKSYGGYMTCMTLFTAGEAFKLGISLAPVVDWKNYDTHYTERYLEHPDENEEGYRLGSPLYHAVNLDKKLLLVHGAVDDNVHFQESVLLAHALQKENKQFDFMLYPKATHAFAGSVVGVHLYNLLTRYIHDNL